MVHRFCVRILFQRQDGAADVTHPAESIAVSDEQLEHVVGQTILPSHVRTPEIDMVIERAERLPNGNVRLLVSARSVMTRDAMLPIILRAPIGGVDRIMEGDTYVVLVDDTS
jgi:hypothetical protein